MDESGTDDTVVSNESDGAKQRKINAENCTKVTTENADAGLNDVTKDGVDDDDHRSNDSDVAGSSGLKHSSQVMDIISILQMIF